MNLGTSWKAGFSEFSRRWTCVAATLHTDRGGVIIMSVTSTGSADGLLPSMAITPGVAQP